ncbi:MAG: 3-deoxy-D-manno-octulosonic acid transferase [Deltaproteobacteria bacterium]|nr:MAG: 3-deoxy-D-manno-octulosonic acid transferase [Deltaproteobacteria bacterium]
MIRKIIAFPYKPDRRIPSVMRDTLICQGYEKLWQAAQPLLKRHPRLRATHARKARLIPPFPRAEIWIQAASAGEAFLAVEIVRELRTQTHSPILVTTGTEQGMEILKKELPTDTVYPHFLPFDRPSLMNQAVSKVAPACMVLLETELWPGLLSVLKEHRVPILLVNARMSEKSFRWYRRFNGLLRAMAPDRILAISDTDAARYADVFPDARTGTMPNIKFDRVQLPTAPPVPLTGLDPDRPFVVLGSVRKEEEPAIIAIIRELNRLAPQVLIGLFPRHMERIPHWVDTLKTAGIPMIRRSDAGSVSPEASVVLWDRFGELGRAYASASAAFIGGSLAPLGGQNFLEPLMHGVRPVIGPSRFNFNWVGDDLFASGLVCVAKTPEAAAYQLVRQVESTTDGNRCQIQSEFQAFLAPRFGGARAACDAIMGTLGSLKGKAE